MLRHWLVATMVLPAMLSAASTARAATTLAEASSELGDWGLAMAEHAGGPPFTFEDVAESIAGSFWYEGLSYDRPYTITDREEQTAKMARPCKKKFGARGVVRGGIPRFLSCLAISSFADANGDTGGWSEASLGKLPAPFRGYRAKLAALAKNHWFVLSYFHDAERRLDLWNLYILERAEGRIAGVLVGRARAGGR